MKKMTFTIIALSLLISGCINEYGKPPSERATRINISDLLQNPVQWKGKLVEVEGAFNCELEGDAIFETNQDQKQKNWKKAISLGLDDPALKIPYGQQDKNSFWRKIFVPLSLRMHIGKPAVVTGVFKPESFGSLSAGTITVKQLSLK